MVKKNILIVFLISVSILFLNCYYIFSNYNNISKEIVTHIDITGKADGFGDKVHLIYAMIANAVLLGIMFFFIKYPKYANYPIEINDKNRDNAYKKMQLFLAIISVVTSVVFSDMVFQAINKSENLIYVILYSITLPLLVLFYFKKNK